MNELTLKFDYWISDDLGSYLLNLKGINNVVIDKEQDMITISYNFNLININIIMKEIGLFLEIQKMPSIIAFDKHFEEKTKEYEIIIKDLCCEYCLKSDIEELLMIDGIVRASSDFDNINKENVKINLNYDDRLISVDEIKELENRFNNNE